TTCCGCILRIEHDVLADFDSPRSREQLLQTRRAMGQNLFEAEQHEQSSALIEIALDALDLFVVHRSKRTRDDQQAAITRNFLGRREVEQGEFEVVFVLKQQRELRITFLL